MKRQRHDFVDFFAGSGLVCEGLKDDFAAVWANDICEKKAAVFYANQPAEVFRLQPIEEVKGADLPQACLSWASFPCQDLSLAGNIRGLSSQRSGLVWEWLRVMDEMDERPPVVVAENVAGLVSADKGAHYRRLHEALSSRGYKVGAVLLDAAYWVPQSRKRVFVIAADETIPTPELECSGPLWCHPGPIQKAAMGLRKWTWWSLPQPEGEPCAIEDIIEFDAPCHDREKTDRLLELIPPNHRERMLEATKNGQCVFPGYRRVRHGKQVLELRFDGVAGCLRTPQGGSSRQFLVIHDNGSWRIRLLTVGETAALMGARKTYAIPGSYNDGYRAMGDAVAVPVARYLSRHLLGPLADLAWERRH